MNLSQRIEADYVAAYKNRDAVRLSVLRLLKTAMKNLLVERRQEPLEEGDILDLVARQCKQRDDSIVQFRTAKRDDLADKEAAELAVLKSYMPEQIAGEALTAVIAVLVAETGAQGVKDMGKVMQALSAARKGQYNGKEAGDLVRAALSGR